MGKAYGSDDRFCTVCGERVNKAAPVCPRCGRPYGNMKYGAYPATGAGGVGWSDQVTNPCFKSRMKKNLIGTLIAMVLVTGGVFAAIWFSSKDREISKILPIFGIVAAALWAFWLIWIIAQFAKHGEWEGVVEKRDSYVQDYTKKNTDGSTNYRSRTVYRITFRTNEGKKKVVKEIDRPVWYDYLHEGEYVRYHGKNMTYYEKYDRSRDSAIPCASCGMMRDARETYCGRCGSVIIKAPVQYYR